MSDPYRNAYLTVLLSILFASSIFAQTDNPPSSRKQSQTGASRTSSSEIQELKDAIAAQQQQIQQQQQQIQEMHQQIVSRDQALQTLEQRVDRADAAVSQAQQAAQKESEVTASDFSTLQHGVTDLEAANASTSA